MAVAASQLTEDTRAESLAARLAEVRALSERLIEPLSAEDCVAQSMPDASPAKWHLAHTSWYFETFLLLPHAAHYSAYDESYQYLFNSYYNAVGPQYSRPRRGLLTRPSLATVQTYRHHVTERLLELLSKGALPDDALELVELGIHHEQQHQELLLMDVKHLLSRHPVDNRYRDDLEDAPTPSQALVWQRFEDSLVEFGHSGLGFAFDNESPRHQASVAAFEIASRPVTNAEVVGFIDGGGYQDASLWLADGWNALQQDAWKHPQYWRLVNDAWEEFTLGGWRALDPHAPAVHLSFYEADAIASWLDARLPTEYEWELAATEFAAGNVLESGRLHPGGAPSSTKAENRFAGDVWEWTRSAYAPYPGFRAPAGAVGEYNGKFMCNQYVLRGGACVTPGSQVRRTYRNFYYPHTYWHFSGVRLARDGR